VSRPAEMPDDMFLAEADPDSIERLLAGRISPDDVPLGYRETARAVRGLRSAASANELARESLAVREALVLLEHRAIDDRGARPREMMARARIGALVLTGMMIATTGAAAANVLPERLERPIVHVLSHVGLTVEARATPTPARTVLRSPPASHRSRESTVPPSDAPAGDVEHREVVPSVGKSRPGRRPNASTPEHPTGSSGHEPSDRGNGHSHRPPRHDVAAHRHAQADEPRARGNGPEHHHRQQSNRHVSRSHRGADGHGRP
jgi:hypothetical protein